MFALDLFNNDHERRLAEGAVDQLEQRRIDDLAMKMDDLVARAKQATTPEVKAALIKEFQKCKAERDSYFKIKDECMGYGSLVGEAGIGQDIADKKEKIARATPPTPAGKVASTVKNAAKWLAGKGGPGKEGPTYESAQKKNSEEVEEAGGWALDPKTRLELKKRKERQKTIAKWAGKPVPPQEPKEKEINEGQRLDVGDPVIVTAPNEFEGKTGEIAEFSPTGKFIIVNLYNHGEQPMHLSDVEYNKYADKQEDDDWYDDEMSEGWSDAIVAQRTGRPRTPYSVYIKGKKWKDFENEDHAEAVANKLRAKFKAEGRDPSVITIAPTDYDKGLEEAEGRVDPILIKALNNMPDGLNSHSQVLNAAYDAYAMELGKLRMKSEYGTTEKYIPQLMSLYKDKHGLTFNEDYSKTPANLELLRDLAQQWQDGSDEAYDAISELGWNIADDRKGVYIIKQSDMSGRSKIYFPELTAEAANPAQQAAIAIAMKKAHKKPKGVDEGDISQLEKDIADAPVKPIANMEESFESKIQLQGVTDQKLLEAARKIDTLSRSYK